MPARPRFLIAAAVLVLALLVPGMAWAMPSSGANAPVVPDTGTLCLTAFDDANSNGVQDAGEGPVAGVVFTVRTEAHVIAVYTTDGQSEPHCLQLLPGEYYATQIDAPGRGPTGDQSWRVPVNANTESTIAYASHAGGGRVPVADFMSTVYALSGIVFFVAAAALGGYVLIQTRRK